jgi:zinc transport system substrate-binding protein
MVLAVALLAGCRSEEGAPVAPERPHYVTTIYPFAAILAPVLEGRADVEHLLPSGASPHTHDLRPSEVRHATRSTAMIFGAPHLDAWAAEMDAPAHIVLLDLLPAAHRLMLPGLDGTATDDVDPHFWTDPLAVRALLPALADTLCALDGGGCSRYQANADSFARALDRLDTELRQMLTSVESTRVMLGQPFFQYFLRRYGFDLVGVVEPVPGREATPRRLRALAETAREENVAVLFVQPQLPANAARAVAEAADLPVVGLDPLGSRATGSYADLLRANARTIREALQ